MPLVCFSLSQHLITIFTNTRVKSTFDSPSLIINILNINAVTPYPFIYVVKGFVNTYVM